MTEGLTVPMATTSSFSKVKDLSSSHPVARQWMMCSGHRPFALAAGGMTGMQSGPNLPGKEKQEESWWQIGELLLIHSEK